MENDALRAGIKYLPDNVELVSLSVVHAEKK